MEKQTLILTASAFIIGFAISAALFLAADSAETKGLSFNQTNLGLRYDMSSPRDQSVFLVFHGESYEEVFTLDQISEPSTKDESSAFVKAITRANTSASLVEFSQLWAPAEREAAILRGRTDNRFERNKKIYAQFERHEFLFKFNYKNRKIFVVKHYFNDGRSLTTFYPTLEIADQFFLTNTLENDPFVFEFLVLLLKEPFMENWEVL